MPQAQQVLQSKKKTLACGKVIPPPALDRQSVRISVQRRTAQQCYSVSATRFFARQFFDQAVHVAFDLVERCVILIGQEAAIAARVFRRPDGPRSSCRSR
jgi:hypothetical protein